MNTSEKVYNTLKISNTPLKAGEIADQSGIDKKEVDKAIKVLVNENKISSPKRCYYQAL
ncbi:MAG: MarR family transcriptional regulator [Bacteroidetes bacterium HGW-Bacteroidetes-16]|jgi:DNA-binding transcriptional regulator GbsR (MarR family)|nr:MAG: MarR family transcriptional regulator [Bacteroidetes bacterium HGW-Bacteroidetes-16]